MTSTRRVTWRSRVRFVSDPLHPLSAATASRCLASTRAAARSPGMGRGSPFPGNQGNAPTSARPPRRVPAEGVLRCPAESAKSFPLHQHFFSRCRQSPLAVVDDDALRLRLLLLLHYHHHHHHLLQFSSTAAASSFLQLVDARRHSLLLRLPLTWLLLQVASPKLLLQCS